MIVEGAMGGGQVHIGPPVAPGMMPGMNVGGGVMGGGGGMGGGGRGGGDFHRRRGRAIKERTSHINSGSFP